MKLLPLTQGKFAQVDDEDFEWLSQSKWCATKAPTDKTHYAMGTEKHGKVWKTIYMHRLILGLKIGDGKFADHVDGDALNNQRSNLRICTKSQNQQNRSMYKNNTSGLKGVYPNKKRWIAKIACNNKKNIHLGSFKTKEEAYEAYKEAVTKYHGNFARLK